MSVTLTMPRLGETMEDGVVTAWLVTPGQCFARGDALIEVETDKMAVEFPALGPGTLLETLVSPGDRVLVGAPIARIDLGGAENWTGGETDEPSTAQPAAPVEASASLPFAEPPTSTKAEGPIRATPPARRAAREAGVDITTLAGTGRRGRIELRDVPGTDSRRALSTASGGQSEAGDIAYTASGPSTGTPVLLLHGYAGDRSTWAVLAAALTRAGMRVVVADLPGHGLTRREARGPEALGDGLDALLKAAFVGARPHVVAHSLGAVAAVALAKAGQAASLTLVAPAGLGLSIDEAFVRGMAAPSSAGEVAHLLRRLSDRPLALSPAAIERLFEDLAKGRLQDLAAAILGPSGQTVDLVPDIEAISRSIPVRVILGHRDRIVDWRDAFNLPPRVAIHHLPSVGHMPHWDAPAEVEDILRRGFS